jgi:alpha-D-ribose 1-methylphosphonate 5-triphosphate synthase subunit PhnG
MQREEINKLSQWVPKQKLKTLCAQIEKTHQVEILTPPTEQTLMVPVHDPISGSVFYAGEVLVTSTIVNVDGQKGWSMVMDANKKLSLYTAIFDACFAQNIYKKEIIELLEKAQEAMKKTTKTLNQKVNATRVSFDLM